MHWSRKSAEWEPPEGWHRIRVVDLHTAGEPLRVVVDGFPRLAGDSILARRRYAREHHDLLRRALMWEPRGHADMYGCLVVPPVSPEAAFGVIFTHNEGYSTMCGHGVIAVATAAVELGVVEVQGGAASFGIDTPAGLVRVRVHVEGSRAGAVSFVNVPSFVLREGEARVAGVGAVPYTVAFGGAFYAYVDADAFGLRLVPDETARLIEVGRRVKAAVAEDAPMAHPAGDGDLNFLYGVIFVGEAHEAGHHSRNVCVFADGEVDRSPTGTGVSGRLAIHHARGELRADTDIVVESILGTTFRGRVVEEVRVGPVRGVVPEISGRAHLVGRGEMLIDPDDPLAGGFLLR